MIYLRLKREIVVPAFTELRLSDVADVLSDARLNVQNRRIRLPQTPGTHRLEALGLVLQLQPIFPDETFNILGNATVKLRRTPPGVPTPRPKSTLLTRVCWCLGALFLVGAWLLKDVQLLPFALGLLVGTAAFSLFFIKALRQGSTP